MVEYTKSRDSFSAPSLVQPLNNQQISNNHNISIIKFTENDPENPRNWSNFKKWSIIIPIILIDLSVSWGASCYSPVSKKFMKDMNVSMEVSILGLSLYVLGLSLGPMSLAPLSEHYGRSPVYIVSYFIFLLFIIGTALVRSLTGFLVLRILSGLFASVTVANLGGTISDLWPHEQTGLPMSIFLWAATVGSPMGFFLFSFVAAYRPWRDVFWALLGTNGGFWVIMCVFLRETRHPVLLRRRAAKERKRTGRDDVDVADDMKTKGLSDLINAALARPFRFLFTEAIIIFAALYNGYLYALSFSFNDAFSLVFGAHGFSTIPIGLSFLGIIIGISIGPITNLYQESYYQSRRRESGNKNVPEARVFLARYASIALPISLFWFAWTSYSTVHWIVPILASVLWGWSFYTLILATYMYVEDGYREYSASALAGVGFVRNLAGAGFPLFANQENKPYSQTNTRMYKNLDFEWASSLLGFLSLLLVPIMFLLFKHGRGLRKRSPWALRYMDDLKQGEQANDEEGGRSPMHT